MSCTRVQSVTLVSCSMSTPISSKHQLYTGIPYRQAAAGRQQRRLLHSDTQRNSCTRAWPKSRSVEGGGDGAGVAFRGVPLLAERVLLRCPWRRCPDRRSERAGRWAVVSERWAVVSERAGEPPLRGLKSCSHGQRGENQRRPSEHLAASAPRPSAQYSRTRARKTSLHSRLLASVCHLEECWPRWRIGI